MNETSDLATFRSLAIELIRAVDLQSSPVGVRVFWKGDEVPRVENQDHLRYCQALMLARRGKQVLVTPDNLACPAAKRAFGFADLPELCQVRK
ncbi:MAG: DUF169 domain-containing protein [Promethearchaeota archaeon]